MRYPIHTIGKQKESAIVSTEKVSMSHEDYLEAIVMLGGTPEHPVRSVDVATKLGISKASVSKAISSLKRHEMLTKFLVIKVGLDPKVAEKEACQMEHAISDESFEKWLSYFQLIGLQA